MSIHPKLEGFVPLILALYLAGCASKPQTVPASPPTQTASSPTPATVTSSIIPGSAQDFRVNVGDTVHFALNKYEIDDSDKTLLKHQAIWLQKYPTVRVTIEGHCDERGTREYNLALGARRANSVKEYLASLGVPFARMETVSYGKERPICTESDEACWAQNRRAVTTTSSGTASS